MGEKDYEATYKILILGDSGVGKTCLIFRFIEDIFSDSYISTIGKLMLLLGLEIPHWFVITILSSAEKFPSLIPFNSAEGQAGLNLV